jgi:ATP-dependent exoDNAse (exonuclease V) beta subunit
MTRPLKPPPDQPQRELALDPTRSILVQAPAGSGKTDLLTRRFLRLLAEVDDPGQIVAITFTKAAAAEMRHRILGELEKADAELTPTAAHGVSAPPPDDFSMAALAQRALAHSRVRGWNLLDLPSQLRITTIDAFCRELALQQPLLSGLGGGLEISNPATALYRRAARKSLEAIGAQRDTNANSRSNSLAAAIEDLLLWRDNNWQELEDLLVEMLQVRDRWMHDFLVDPNPEWNDLRNRLERPFANAVHIALEHLMNLLDCVPGCRDEALSLARFACEEPGAKSPRDLAELAELPSSLEAGFESVHEDYLKLMDFLQTDKGAWRKESGLNVNFGFPATPRGRAGKARFGAFIQRLNSVVDLEAALYSLRDLPPPRYSEDDWRIVRACFMLLRRAAAELKVVFAEAAMVDYTEVAQIAQNVLNGADGLPSDPAIAVADGVRHLLVDEFQDTSRRQHQLLASLIAAWPEPTGRTCYFVGDPMQSIYFFRDADAELFPRVRHLGLELPNGEALAFQPVSLTANFRTVPALVAQLNDAFAKVFGPDSPVPFESAQPQLEPSQSADPALSLHLRFIPCRPRGKTADPLVATTRLEAHETQIDEIVQLIASYSNRIAEARSAREVEQDRKFRVAVLARAKKSLAPIAQALHDVGIPFRAVELENLSDRPEILDALALARALLNPQDRVAWLGVLRAPWCGLSLADLATLAEESAPAEPDDPRPDRKARPIPDLLAERIPLLSSDARPAAERVLHAITSAPTLRAAQPSAALGTWLQQVWLMLGGDATVDPTARANVDLLFGRLDQLPQKDADLIGPALDAALGNLTTLPDPDADPECGVQLMTIHKAKGLEFEVVIVPELQDGAGHNRSKMLSWLERGLSPDMAAGSAGEITEFLVAPIQTKGAERGQAQSWVESVRSTRETEESTRILYVAATRARNELHLFARPEYKTEKDGSLTLAEPSNSLLATAWPALEYEVRQQFDAWKQGQASAPSSIELLSAALSSAPEPLELRSLAAAAETNIIQMPPPPKPTRLRRLPADFSFRDQSQLEVERLLTVESAPPDAPLYARHEGGLASRALGTAVHALLQQLARLRADSDWTSARTALQQFAPRIQAAIRSAGVDPAHAGSLAAEAMGLVLNASHDPNAAWILSPHLGAASEIRWTGVLDSSIHSVQIDRLFQAGPAPQSEGESVWWIIDYKTAHTPAAQPNAVPDMTTLRSFYARQLEIYARVLRNLHGANAPIRAGLYYPRMAALDWWEV